MIHVASYHYHPLAKKNLFQHDMTLTYKHVLSNYALYGYVDIIQEIVNKGTYVAKGENKEMLLYLACANNHNGVIFILCIVFNFLFTFLFHIS
jgi:hypothetical protein